MCFAYAYMALSLFLLSLYRCSAVVVSLCPVDQDFGLSTQIGIGIFFSYDKVTDRNTSIPPHHVDSYAHSDLLYVQTTPFSHCSRYHVTEVVPLSVVPCFAVRLLMWHDGNPGHEPGVHGQLWE